MRVGRRCSDGKRRRSSADIVTFLVLFEGAVVLVVASILLSWAVVAATTAAGTSDDAHAFTNRGGTQQQLRLPTFLASHMVLQRDTSANLWGWATPLSNVTVTVSTTSTTSSSSNNSSNNNKANDSSDAVSDSAFVRRSRTALEEGPANAAMVTVVAHSLSDPVDGSWLVALPPQEAGSGYQIVVSDGVTSITLEDVAFGDVFLCSGQSNMEMSVGDAFNASAEIADSGNYPDLRLATAEKVMADAPQDDVGSKSDSYVWSRSGPSAMDPKRQFSWYSATCYFFGRELYRSMDGKVPIGLVTSCWGGQQVEAFSSPDALADDSCGGTQASHPNNVFIETDDYDRVNDDGSSVSSSTMSTASESGNVQVGSQPTKIWNAMIHPFLNMRFTSAIWYQGEANSGNATNYACRFPAMISDWRDKFNLPNLSFFYVQLAAYQSEHSFSFIRAAQDAALALPRVGVAIATDLGDPTSPHGSIHSRRKQEVGRRLAAIVRNIQYGDSSVPGEGPVYDLIHRTDDGATIGYGAGTTDGLHMEGTAACSECCYESPFQVLDANGNWTRAIAAIVGKDTIHLKPPSASSLPILGIRYDWEGYPQCALYNGRGGPDDHTALPAAPFEWCAHPSGEASWTENARRTASSLRRTTAAPRKGTLRVQNSYKVAS